MTSGSYKKECNIETSRIHSKIFLAKLHLIINYKVMQLQYMLIIIYHLTAKF